MDLKPGRSRSRRRNHRLPLCPPVLSSIQSARSSHFARGKTLGLLGLAFKQNTDDVRNSPAIELCLRLQSAGASLRVHDPQAMDKAAAILKDVAFVPDMNQVAEGCDALVIATEWPEFQQLDLDRVRRALSHPIIFDGRNLFDPAEMERLGFLYKSIGR